MPEGDTIFRTAVSLRRWVGGRTVTGGLGADRVVGADVQVVEAKGKHLVLRFSNRWLLHTHMRMSGSWHVYPTGERWQRPAAQARVVIECGDRVAVCFNAPVVEWLRDHEERLHGPLVRLGPDLLAPGAGGFKADLDEVVRRAAARPPSMLVGELLLDQEVAAGIGNVYRCETLFLCGLDPWTPRESVGEPRLRALMTRARDLLAMNAANPFTRDVGLGPGQTYVYGRPHRPCRRCGTVIRTARLGFQARSIFWCPSCQVLPP